MSTHQSKHEPILLNPPQQDSRFKATCMTCFIAARSVPRALEEVPKYLNELATDLSEAWEESGKKR